MIPKVIHYVWLGKGPVPAKMQKCIDSWRRVMPDYQIKCWDEDVLDEFDNIFVREAIAEKKWAFAADVIRLYVLYKYGGIYLDTDVEVVKPFDPLLDNRAFIGRETCMHIFWQSAVNHLTTCCIGSEPGNPYIETCLKYYDNRHFVNSTNRELPCELRLDMRTNSDVMHQLAVLRGYKPSILQNHTQHCDGTVTIYPSEYFEPHDVTVESYCVHLALGTWRERSEPATEATAPAAKYGLKDKIAARLWLALERFARRHNRLLINVKE